MSVTRNEVWKTSDSCRGKLLSLFVATMPAPYEPAGAPTAEGKSEDGDMTWADYADHTRIQKKTNGDIHYIYKSGDHGVQQYCECSLRATVGECCTFCS